jgi:hypothetical protein
MAQPDASHISFTYPPVASMWVDTHHYLLYNLTYPYPHPSYWLRLFSSHTFSLWIPQHFSDLVILNLLAYKKWDRVFRNVGTSNSDAGELPRKNDKAICILFVSITPRLSALFLTPCIHQAAVPHVDCKRKFLLNSMRIVNDSVMPVLG